MAPDTASAHSVKASADTRLCGANRPKLANSRSARRSEDRRMPLEFSLRSAGPAASGYRQSCRLASWLAPAAIGGGYLQALRRGANPLTAGAARMSTDCRGRHLADQSGHLHRTTACPLWPKSGHTKTQNVLCPILVAVAWPRNGGQQ